MKRFLLVLVVAALAMPAYGEVFKASQDGSFDTYRSGDEAAWAGEGYSNGNAGGYPRLTKFNQQMGWFSFKTAVEDTTQQTLADFLAANANVTAWFYVGFHDQTLQDASIILVSLRCGNTGDLNAGNVNKDSGNGNGFVYNFLPTADPLDPLLLSSFVGSSELVAFSGCSDDGNGVFAANGCGIYYNDTPVGNAAKQGVPWITPSGRKLSGGMSPQQFGPNQPVRYDTGLMGAGTAATNLYRGYFWDTPVGTGRAIWALEDVLGFWTNKTIDHTFQQIYDAGQIINGGLASPTIVTMASNYMAPDPIVGQGEWLAIPLDDTFLRDMVNNPENKGFVVDNSYLGTTASWNNCNFNARDWQGAPGPWSPYLLILPTTVGGCWGDIDASGMVNGDDLAILAYAWLATPADPNWYAPADLTGDNVVNGDDLAVVAYGWLQCIPM